MTDIEPKEPREAGVDESRPDLAEIESAELLANHARGRLQKEGFQESQIENWAQAYIREHGPGDVEDFVGWVAHQERTGS